MSVNQGVSCADPQGRTPFRMAALAVPADKDYLALIRTAAMHVAILLPLTVDRIADLRLAVDEACTALLAGPHGAAAAAAPADGAGELLELSFERYPDRVEITVRGPARGGLPGRDEIGWAMLEALVGEVRVAFEGGASAELTLVVPLPSEA